MTDLMNDQQLSLFDLDPEPEITPKSKMMGFRLKEQKVRLRLKEGPGIYSVYPIQNVDAAVQVMAKALKEMDREYMIVVNLNTRKQPIGYSVVSMGTLNMSVVGISEVFKTAILSNADSIIMMHNHPSGTREALEPSKEDLQITKRVAYAGTIMNIELLDHIIVSGGDYLSLHSLYPDCGWSDKSESEFERMFRHRSGKTM